MQINLPIHSTIYITLYSKGKLNTAHKPLHQVLQLKKIILTVILTEPYLSLFYKS